LIHLKLLKSFLFDKLKVFRHLNDLPNTFERKNKKKLWFYLFFYGMFLYVNCITLILLTIILGCICRPGTACCSVTSVFVSIATTTYFYSMQQQIYHTHIPCRLVADVGHLVPSLSCPLSVCSIEETELLCLFLSPTPYSIC
jgi:glucan phosphoethanolaminetransferase (alkaline phosphatase superfamily)